MFDGAFVRRALLTVAFGVLCITVGYQYAWHKNEFDFGNSVASLSRLVVVVVYAGLLLWMALHRKSDSPLKIVAATVLGADGVIYGKDVLSGIDTQNLLILLGVVLAFIAFVVLISVRDLSFLGKFKRTTVSSADEEDDSSAPTSILDGPTVASVN